MKNSKLAIFLKGLIIENPVLVLVLGTCPTLAQTGSVINALSMGLAATVVLICSNVVISALRKIIPDTVRIPCYIVVIAGFVTVVSMIMQAYLPELFDMMGVFLALIVVNCIILGRAEMFARKNGVIDSALDGAGMGLGFLLALLAMATVREVIGAGSFAGFELGLNAKNVYLKNIDITLYREKYPYSYFLCIGPKSARGDGGIEFFDPYFSSEVENLYLENIKINGQKPNDISPYIREIAFNSLYDDLESTAYGKIKNIIYKNR
jgi:electron transport complex protein RnfE